MKERKDEKSISLCSFLGEELTFGNDNENTKETQESQWVNILSILMFPDKNSRMKDGRAVLFFSFNLFIFSQSRQDNNVDSTSFLKETEKTEEPKQGN